MFGDLRALATTEARIVLGAAVADDVLGLIILTVVVKVVSGDSVTVGVVVSTLLVAVGFLVLSGFAGIVAVPRLLTLTERLSRSGTTLTVVALVVVLGFAVLADAAQLAFIIGAFIAGLAIGRSDQHERIAGDLNSVGGVLIPVFFVLIGVHADLAAMLRPSVLLDAAVLLAIAIAGKLLSAYGAAGTRSDRLLIGIGMVPRGEVGLIFASIGLAQGVLDDELYGALLLVVLLTTVIAPPALRWRMGMRARAVTAATTTRRPNRPPVGCRSHDGELVLDGRPPSSAIVSVALQAAALARGGRPSDDLLSWFGERRDVEVTWTHGDTVALLDVLRRGGPRAVRLLDVTGVLRAGRADGGGRGGAASRRSERARSVAGAPVPDRRPRRRAARRIRAARARTGDRQARRARARRARPRRHADRRAPAARRARRRRSARSRASALLGTAAAGRRR